MNLFSLLTVLATVANAAPVDPQPGLNLFNLANLIPLLKETALRNSGFHNMTCTEKVTNAALPAADRWATAKADDSLQYFLMKAQNDSSIYGDLRFVPAFSNFYHGPQGWDCDLKHDQCGSGVQECETMDNPGSWMVLNSFTEIHLFYLNWYTSLGDAAGSVSGSIGRYNEVFNGEPKDDGDWFAKLLLELVSIGFGQIGGRVFKLGFEKLLKDKEKIEKATETMSSMMAGSMRTVTKRKPDIDGALGHQNQASQAVTKLVDEWRVTIVDALDAWLNPNWDDNEAHAALAESLKEGRWLGVETEDLYDMKNILEKTIYGMMLPKIWRQRENIHPVIIMEDYECNAERPGAPDYNDDYEEDDNTFRYVNPDDAQKAKVCHDGKTFYVLQHNDDGWSTSSRTVGAGFGQRTMKAGTQHAMNNIAGGNWDELNSHNWGGVTLDDVVISSYEAYKFNGMKNGYQIPEDSKLKNGGGEETLLPFEEGLRTPGLISIPICKAKDAYVHISNNLRGDWKDGPGPNYPCPP